MHCQDCSANLRHRCDSQGCCARLAEMRAETCVGSFRDGVLAKARLDLGLRPVAEAIDRQLTELDVENGCILVLRTRQKLRPEMAAEWQEELKALCRSQGVRDVSVVVLDNCSSLTVERRSVPDTRMQYQPVKGAPIVSY